MVKVGVARQRKSCVRFKKMSLMLTSMFYFLIWLLIQAVSELRDVVYTVSI